MERRFTEKQVADVIRKATEIQAGLPSTPASGSITETNLRDAAREIGLDPTVVAQAIAQLDNAPKQGSSGFWGGPLVSEHETVFEGHLSEADWEDVLADIRRVMGETGEVTQRGSTLEWTGSGGGVTGTHLTLTQSDGQVRVRTLSRLDGLAVVHYLTSLVPIVIGAPVMSKLLTLPAPTEVALAFGFAGAVFLGTRALFSRNARKSDTEVRALVGRIESRCADQVSGHLEGVTPVVEPERFDPMIQDEQR